MAETTLAAALTSAFDNAEREQAEQVTTETAAPAETAAPTATERTRDESGRFAPKQDVATGEMASPAKAAAPPLSGVSTSQPVAPERVPPSSWKKEYWDAYKTLDPKVADYIKQREDQFIHGVTTYKQEAEAAREIRETLAPFEQDFRTAGVSPAQGIQRLAEAHRSIRNAPPEGRIAIFQKLAQEYGVPLQSIQTGQVDPLMQYLSPLQQEIAQLRAEQNSFVEQQRNQEQTAMQTEIENFAATHEHFEAVRADMSGLLQHGMAPNLQSAYDKAVGMNGLAATQSQPNNAAIVSKARATAISPKSATPSAVTAPSGKKDVRSILEETVEQFLGGARV